MSGSKIQAVAIGASAGAVDALSKLLPVLPEKFPLPVFIVVHLPADKKSIMAELFNGKCMLEVKEAEDKEDIRPGVVYFAPPDYHLLIEKDKIISLSSEEPVLFSRPSIDVLFETAADAYGEGLLGIILTGANEDGANGLRIISEEGGTAIVQDPQHAFAPYMPQAAIKACPKAKIMQLREIAEYLQEVKTSCTL